MNGNNHPNDVYKDRLIDNEHHALLTAFLKQAAQDTPGIPHRNVLFEDTIEDRRVDLSLWYEPSDNKYYIAGDAGQSIELYELELIDNTVLNFKPAITADNSPQEQSPELIIKKRIADIKSSLVEYEDASEYKKQLVRIDELEYILTLLK